MKNFSEFVGQLRRYKKDDVVINCTEYLWNIFQNKEAYDPQIVHLVNAYAPRLLMLSFATGNNYRSIPLNNSVINQLCCDYVEINDKETDRQFVVSESEMIAQLFLTRDKKVIPDKYINVGIISEIFSGLFLSRLIKQQHETFLVCINEFYMTYDILERLNISSSGESHKVFKELFQLDPLLFMRSAFALFAVANNKSGKIKFNEITYDVEICQKLSIDLGTCKVAAEKLSTIESEHREKWYETRVLRVAPQYQKYYPTLLYNKPVVKTNLTSGIDYLIPAPAEFIRGVRECIFTLLLSNGKNKFDIGGAIENHIYEGLKVMFGSDQVSKIPIKLGHSSADFKVELANCILIIECKASSGANVDLSILSPESIVEIWSRLYKACWQCSVSIDNLNPNEKPIIPLVLVASHLTAEAMPFQRYAFRAGIFDDMKIDYIEFISWNALQYALANSSIEKFSAKLIERKTRAEGTVQEMMFFELDRDIPTHNYEYLRAQKKLIDGNL